MKKLIMIACAVVLFSCGNSKETTNGENTDNNTNTTETMKDAVTGTIKDMTKTDGCDFIIEVTVDGKVIKLEPLALDEKYKVDGKTVKLIYLPSRRQSKCMGTMPITIEKIME
jgi:hypothetical protein